MSNLKSVVEESRGRVVEFCLRGVKDSAIDLRKLMKFNSWDYNFSLVSGSRRLDCHRDVLTNSSWIVYNFLVSNPSKKTMEISSKYCHVLGFLFDFMYDGKTVIFESNAELFEDLCHYLSISFESNFVDSMTKELSNFSFS